MKKNKVARYGLIVVISMVMVIPQLIQSASAVVVNDYTWKTTYSNPANQAYNPAESVGRDLHIVSDGGHISFDLGLAVDVIQYGNDNYQNYNYVTFKTSAFFSSEAQTPYVAATADTIMLYVEKIDDRYYSNQAIAVLANGETEQVPNAVGSNMMHPSEHLTLGEFEELGGVWYVTAEHAIILALDEVPGLGALIDYVLDIGKLYNQEGTDADSAAFSASQTSAWSRWVDSLPGAYPNPGDTVTQECFQMFDWRQSDWVNPSTYMRIKVYAGLLIKVPTWEDSEFSTFTYYTNPIYLTIYHKTTSGGGGGCPFLYVYDGSSYVDDGYLNIHNVEGYDLVVEHMLDTTPQSVNGRYLLRLEEESQHFSELDQVRLLALLDNGNTINLPLLSAIHSRYGDVRSYLSKSDDIRTNIYGTGYGGLGQSDYIDLAFAAAGWNNHNIVGLQFVIEGHNMKWM